MSESPRREHAEVDAAALRERTDRAAFELVSIVLSRWAVVLLVTALTVGVAVVGVFLTRDYVAETRFLPQTGDNGVSGLAGFAAQMGLPLDVPRGGESLEFYAALVESSDLLSRLVTTEFTSREDGAPSDTAPLMELLGVGGNGEQERVRSAVGQLRSRISVQRDLPAGLITVRVRMSSGPLAEEVARELWRLVNEFNIERRQSRASQERTFVEDRLNQARHELEESEGELEAFLDANRRFNDSPQLTFEAGRLQRRVELRQQVYLMLAQAYEQARIDEVRDVPLVTMVDRPEGSAVRRPGWAVPVASASLLGLFAGVLVALTGEYLARVRRDDPTVYAALAAASRRGAGAYR